MGADTALVVIDVQVGLMEKAYRRDEILGTINQMLESARSSGTPVIYVQHDAPGGGVLEVGTPNWQIHPAIAPREGEVVVRKESPDAFHQTRLQEELTARDVKRLVIVGGQTQYCVDTTTRRAVAEGYDVLLVSDAHTTYDSRTLTAAQIIDFYNEALHSFWAGGHEVKVQAASEVTF